MSRLNVTRLVPPVTALSIAALVAVLAASRCAPAQDDVETLEQQAIRAAVERVAPSVVLIETTGGLERVGRVLFGTGPTTGLVVETDEKSNYILSSAFNFRNRPATILVRLPDGKRVPAKLVATDHNRMLALLKIDLDKPLPVPELAPEEPLRVGQWTIAVGRTFEAEEPNMSVGILSARNRIWGKAIQTDAAVSPNNYGGPLVDIQGRVLGVIVPLSPRAAAETAGVEWYDSGIGFAIPAKYYIDHVLARMKKGEDLHAGVIGIAFRQRSLHLADPVVGQVRPNSPAQKGGLKSGDRIVKIEDREITRAAEVKEEISRRYAGDKLRVEVMRDDKPVSLEIEIAAKLEPYQQPLLGVLPMRTVPDPEAGAAGVEVRYVYPDGPAAKAGIEQGDVLVKLNGDPIDGPAQLRERLAALEPGAEVEVEARRGDATSKYKVALGTVPEDLPPAELPPARPDREKPEGERPHVGVEQVKIPEFQNDAWTYVPETYDPAVAYGLVVWLHVPGKFDRDAVINTWKPYCDKHDLILLAPKGTDDEKWLPTEVSLIQKLIEQVESTYNLDPTRIVVHGHQGGAGIAWMVAQRSPERVRAVAAVDAPISGRPPENDPAHPFSAYIAWSEKSEAKDRIEAGVKQLRNAKYPVTVNKLGEDPRYLNDEELAELVRWIDMLDRI